MYRRPVFRLQIGCLGTAFLFSHLAEPFWFQPASPEASAALTVLSQLVYTMQLSLEASFPSDCQRKYLMNPKHLSQLLFCKALVSLLLPGEVWLVWLLKTKKLC